MVPRTGAVYTWHNSPKFYYTRIVLARAGISLKVNTCPSKIN